MLTRLIYASEADAALTPAQVDDMLVHARKNNLRQHLTGLLLFDSQCFLQVLEGSRASVSDTFGKILRDPRHRRVELLESTAVDARHFDRWQMAFSPALASHQVVYHRYGCEPRFNPFGMTAGAALHLLVALSPAH